MPPAGHYGDVEKEIGRACVQLASPDFKFMSGETITLEGGMDLRPYRESKTYHEKSGRAAVQPSRFFHEASIFLVLHEFLWD